MTTSAKRSILESLNSNKSAKRPVSTDPQAFVEEGDYHTLTPTPDEDWRSQDPEAKPTYGLHLKLNDYEIGLVRHLAKREKRSMHMTIKRHLVPGLRAAEEESRELDRLEALAAQEGTSVEALQGEAVKLLLAQRRRSARAS